MPKRIWHAACYYIKFSNSLNSVITLLLQWCKFWHCKDSELTGMNVKWKDIFFLMHTCTAITVKLFWGDYTCSITSCKTSFSCPLFQANLDIRLDGDSFKPTDIRAVQLQFYFFNLSFWTLFSKPYTLLDTADQQFINE